MEAYYRQLATLRPDPALSPAQVVQIQLEALQNNDLSADNRGIRIAFAFASPANRESTGPIERFILLVKSPLYRPLIGFERARFGGVIAAGAQAQQSVRLYHTSGETALYIFYVTRQDSPLYTDCWMTDAVIRRT